MTSEINNHNPKTNAGTSLAAEVMHQSMVLVNNNGIVATDGLTALTQDPHAFNLRRLCIISTHTITTTHMLTSSQRHAPSPHTPTHTHTLEKADREHLE